MRVTFNGVATEIIALNCQLKGSILFLFIKKGLEHILHFPFSRSSCSSNRNSLPHGVSGVTVLISSNLTQLHKLAILSSPPIRQKKQAREFRCQRMYSNRKSLSHGVRVELLYWYLLTWHSYISWPYFRHHLLGKKRQAREFRCQRMYSN